MARLRRATSEPKYAAKMWVNFRASALERGDSISRYGFWNASAALFYRDGSGPPRTVKRPERFSM
jgi:hypothetical protein